VNNRKRKDQTVAKNKGAAERAALTVREAADILGLGINQTYEGIRAGQIPSIKVGKRIIVPRAALEKKLEAAR
jgi:excisionase family DNA binding protein